jgi:hypothetical protein
VIRTRVPAFSIPAGIRHWPGEMSVRVAVVKPDETTGATFPGDDGADQRVEGMSGHFPRRRSR